ncbi:hypothetical protein Vadar_014892 [Vaccinium darrowii]|uniref:Uncharacterized protein n=1 Tax=Vaccinium darrowii TaxID=229202 RepID=A0ACB7XZ09_9ERIC|nr:hypothetical protein Vadar_014892 [Vaccinium darrowii]
MARKVRSTFVSVVALIISLACFYHQLFSQPPRVSSVNLLSPPFTTTTNPIIVIPQHQQEEEKQSSHDHVISTVSVLLPAWEILVILMPENPIPLDYDTGQYICLFPNNDTSPARPSGILRFPYRATFKCDLPERLRRRLPFPPPVLTTSKDNPPEKNTSAPQLLRWNFLVYESLSTENDVILFVKGLNNRQGVNRTPNEFRCVFGDAVNGIRTAVTSSIQEVFRCRLPEGNAVSSSDDKPIKISLEIPGQNLAVPSVAYYIRSRKVAPEQPKLLLCACTMVYNAAKYLKEWVVYHSEIGIEKFILYDNGSDDDLERVVAEVVDQGYNVSTSFWLWPKTQEAGFSHCAVNAKGSCTWMVYIDIDEFIYSPSWLNSSKPSDQMLKSLLPKKTSSNNQIGGVGEVMINCYEFGPSNQKSHPVNGVMQGYNCRRKEENRHKSIVLLDAIDESLLNVIHHFQLKDGYKMKKVELQHAVVNHYKFQAWSEFKTKFRRRVSAYVVDWMQAINLESKDRTPGLGYAPVEPQGWLEKFCEVYDNRLKDLTRRWFGTESESGYLMAWQI